MSDDKNDSYAELAQEIQRRGEEIFASYSTQAEYYAIPEKIIALVAEGERRFAELLATRQGTVPADFDLLYKLKSDLDRRLLDRPRHDRP